MKNFLLFCLFFCLLLMSSVGVYGGQLEMIRDQGLKVFEKLKEEIKTLKTMLQNSTKKEEELKKLLKDTKNSSKKDIEELRKSLMIQKGITNRLKARLKESELELKKLKNTLNFYTILSIVSSLIAGVLAGIAIDRIFLREG